MSIKQKFQSIQNIIPVGEALKRRNFTLFENNLYFIGDRSWFKIENFIESDSNLVLSYNELMPIITMDGEITASKLDNNMIQFKNDKSTLKLSLRYDNIKEPVVDIPADSEFVELPIILKRGRPLLRMMGEDARCSVLTIKKDNEEDNTGLLALQTGNRLYLITGDSGLDIELTDIPEVMGYIISQGAEVKLDNQLITSKLKNEDGTYSYSSIKYSKSRYPVSEAESLHLIANGKYEESSEAQPIAQVTIEAKELLDFLPVVSQMQHQQYMLFEALSGVLKMSVTDSLGNVFETITDCESTEDIIFETGILDKPTIDYITEASESSSGKLVFNVNTWKNSLVLRAADEDNKDKALCLMKVM